jgi:hypothetical protein
MRFQKIASTFRAKPRWGGVVAEDGLHQLDMTGPFGLLQTKVRGKIVVDASFVAPKKI